MNFNIPPMMGTPTMPGTNGPMGAPAPFIASQGAASGAMYSPYQGARLEPFGIDAPAVLVMFQPNMRHNVGLQAHRPLLYNFDNSFVTTAQEVVSMTHSAGGPQHMGVVDAALATPEARRSITAAPTPDMFVNFNPLIAYWRFMLILNQVKAPDFSGAAMFTPMVNHRVVLNGYFLDCEPISMSGALNNQAVMVFTHKSVFETIRQHRQDGTHVSHLNTRLDQNFVNHSLPSFTSDPSLFYIDPKNSYDATYSDSTGQTVSAPGHLQRVGYNQTNAALDSKLESPTHNLRHLVGNIISAKREVGDRPHLSSVYSESRINLPSHNLESFNEILGRNLNSRGDNAALLGPNENETKLLGALDAEYGNGLKVQVVNSDQTGAFDVLDQSINMYQNVANSLIAAAAPSAMASAALARLDFRFTSMYAKNDPLMPYQFDCLFVIPFMPMQQNLLNQRVSAVIGELYRGVFRSVYEGANQTDFSLTASIDLGGLTNLNLHIHDGSPKIREPYQHPTVYGGMNTPLIGTAPMCAHNSSQIASFVDEMAGAGVGFEIAGEQHVVDSPMQVTPGTTTFPQLNI